MLEILTTFLAVVGGTWIAYRAIRFMVRAFPLIDWHYIGGMTLITLFYVVWMLGCWKVYEIARWLWTQST